MRRLALALLATMTGSTVLAQGRPSSMQMTCSSAASLVQSRGALVIGTGGDTFDRAVRDAAFCPPFSNLKPLFAPTRDNPQCLIGYRCYDFPLDPD